MSFFVFVLFLYLMLHEDYSRTLNFYFGKNNPDMFKLMLISAINCDMNLFIIKHFIRFIFTRTQVVSFYDKYFDFYLSRYC